LCTIRCARRRYRRARRAAATQWRTAVPSRRAPQDAWQALVGTAFHDATVRSAQANALDATDRECRDIRRCGAARLTSPGPRSGRLEGVLRADRQGMGHAAGRLCSASARPRRSRAGPIARACLADPRAAAAAATRCSRSSPDHDPAGAPRSAASMLVGAYTNAQGRRQLLETLAARHEQIGVALAKPRGGVRAARHNGADRLEERLCPTAPDAYGQAQRASSEFPAR